jgi:hypothetical protein
MKKVFVCSKLRGKTIKEMEKNISNAIKYCKFVVASGYLPLTPHIYFTRFLDDTKKEEREKGISMGLEWLKEADEVWVFGDFISEGMSKELKYAESKGIPIINIKKIYRGE